MINLVKRQVSQDKRRFQEDGFDLDLTYIHPKVIAMGYPAEGIQAYYRNNIEDVARLLDQKHLNHYRVYNLTETPYDTTLFHNNVKWFPFPDHHNPSLLTLCHIIDDMYQYYEKDPSNVVVVHCLAGRGRTGAIITSFLQYANICSTPQEALDKFAMTRSTTNKGVVMPSQVRYVHYFGELISKNISLISPTYLVQSISIGPLSNQGTSNSFYELDISDIDNYYSPFIVIQPSTTFSPTYSCDCDTTNTIKVFFDPPIPLSGDVNVRVRLLDYSQTYGSTIVCRTSFHTYFLDSSSLDLTLKEIDVRKPFKSKVSSKLQMHFAFTDFAPSVPLHDSELQFFNHFYDHYIKIKTNDASKTELTFQQPISPKLIYTQPPKSFSEAASPSSCQITIFPPSLGESSIGSDEKKGYGSSLTNSSSASPSLAGRKRNAVTLKLFK